MDRLSPVFLHFAPTARVFNSGPLCKVTEFDECEGVGHIHLLREGRLLVTDHHEGYMELSEPTVLFYPRPFYHRFIPQDEQGADLLCASVDLGGRSANPLLSTLPEVLVIRLKEVSGLASVLDLMFNEAFKDLCGRQAALDRLMEYFLILLLRHVMEEGDIPAGPLSALGDSRLAKAITAIHNRPEFSWTLEELAAEAGMSRARFAVHFKEKVGMTPLDYLTDWRLSIARTLLRKGGSVKSISPKVGYRSPAAFTRVFTRKLGVSPTEWQPDMG